MVKYLSRNKIYEKLEATKDAKKVYVFCEGEKKEINYLLFFQGFSSNINIIPIPPENSKSDPEKLKENADKIFFGEDPKHKLSPEYKDEVWFVIDTDRWNEGNKIQTLRNYCNEKNQEYYGWFVSQSNPSFELWLYYHFHTVKPVADDVNKHNSFKAFVHKKLGGGGFDNRSMPLEIQQAIANAENNFEDENGQPKIYTTEVYRLGKILLPFIKEQLDKCIENMKNL